MWPRTKWWDRIKDQLKGKYVPLLFHDRLMDKWHQFTQGNKSTKEYIEKFDEFVIRCNTLNTEKHDQILSISRARLREDLQIELLARGVIEIAKAYTIVQDLYSFWSNCKLGVLIQNQLHLEPPLQSLISLVPKLPHIGMTSRARVLNGTIKIRVPSFQSKFHNQVLQMLRLWTLSSQMF